MRIMYYIPALFVLAVFALPSVTHANTICYPDGCAVLNFDESKSTWDALFGNQTTVAAVFEVAVQYAAAHGDVVNQVVRNAAGNITFVDCGNGHTHTLVYNCSYQYTCSGNNLVDYCGTVSACDNGCSNNACQSAVQHAPSVPTLSSNAACVLGLPHYITFNSSDPDGDDIKYGVDWDANGVVDQWVPPDGFVPSGTPQSVSRTYSISGLKTVKVMAQDRTGLSSDWAGISFSCTATSSAAIGGFTGNSSGNNNVNINGNANPPPAADLEINVIPSLVRSGYTTKVIWSAANVTSCTVTAPNGDHWSTIVSVLGGATSKPISQVTTYTLKCLDLQGATKTKTATVRILPNFKEL